MDRYAVFSTFFYRCYAALWHLALPVLRRRKRLADGWHERLVPSRWLEKPVDLWIQAASGGEAHLALELIRAFPDRASLRVLLTTWTRQGRAVLEKGLLDLQAERSWLSGEVRFAPLDAPGTVRRALKQARPRLLVLLETELWPGLLGACAESGVPVHIVNGRMTKASFEGYRIIRPVLRRLPLRGIHAVSAEDAERFAFLFGGAGGKDSSEKAAVDIMPNIKFDRAVAGLSATLPHGLASLFRYAGPVFLLASVRKQEETRLAPLVLRLRAAYPRAVVVVVPRHMHRVTAWMSRLYDLGLQPRAISEFGQGEACSPGGTLVWDRFGDLPCLYAAADAVYVGGSFGQGGQNFLEPLATGMVPRVGPAPDNFRWALGEDQPPSLQDAELVVLCPSVRKLGISLIKAVEVRGDREEIRQRFRKWLMPRTGGARWAALRLAESLDTPSREVPSTEKHF